MRVAQDVPRRQPTPPKKLTGFWNEEEHMSVLLDILHSCSPLTCKSCDLLFTFALLLEMISTHSM
jgi:hypothetical protein